VFARFFCPFFACCSLSEKRVFGWTRCEIWPWHNPPSTAFSRYKQSRSDTGSTQKIGIRINKEGESKRFSHQRRRTSQLNCWLWVVYMFPESKKFLSDENLRSFNLDWQNNTLCQKYFPQFKVGQVSYQVHLYEFSFEISTTQLGVDFAHVLYELLIHAQHNQHVDLFRIEKRIHRVTHVIGIRKIRSQQLSAHNALIWPSEEEAMKRSHPYAWWPHSSVLSPMIRMESPRLPVEHVAAASLSASWTCSRSKSKASRCWELRKIISRTFNSPGKKITFDLFFGHDRDLPPLPGSLEWVLRTACTCDFRGVTWQVVRLDKPLLVN